MFRVNELFTIINGAKAQDVLPQVVLLDKMTAVVESASEDVASHAMAEFLNESGYGHISNALHKYLQGRNSRLAAVAA